MSLARETLHSEYSEEGVIGQIIWTGVISEETQKSFVEKKKKGLGVGKRRLLSLEEEEEEEVVEEEEEEEVMRATVLTGDVEIFQIVLWLSVILTFITYGSIYSLAHNQVHLSEQR
eukprot:TRINITY_DN7437_c0_g1_i1.p1 TRINITY_DN7437_c0_g1~~TRINITY_DN7437_c0_g1_i1.p1  ORF type:complete len:116 (-),score=29.36 TRINITY_DN7437_c0_g1_i1:156-503(-)